VSRADSVVDESDLSDDGEDDDFIARQVEPATRRAIPKRTDTCRTAAPKAAKTHFGPFGARKRPAEVPLTKAKKVCREAPRSSEADRLVGFLEDFM
jgi:hypothetical protein